MIIDIYRDRVLKYPLLDEEYNHIDMVWMFFDEFNRDQVYLSEYRDQLITNIKNKYTPEIFYAYEKILSKMLWNLRWLIFPLWLEPTQSQEEYWRYVLNNYGNNIDIPYAMTMSRPKKYKNKKDLKKKINKHRTKKTGYHRSFINKMIVIDDKKQLLYLKPVEGSSDVLAKNWFNLYTYNIMKNRDTYELIMSNPFLIFRTKVSIPEYYHEQTYPFPNLNFMRYKIGSRQMRMNRIKEMYYEKNAGKNWFRLIS